MDVEYIEKYHLTNRQLFIKELWRDLYQASLKTGQFSSKENSVLFNSYTFIGPKTTRTIFGIISNLFEEYFRRRIETKEGLGALWFTSNVGPYSFHVIDQLEIQADNLEKERGRA